MTQQTTFRQSLYHFNYFLTIYYLFHLIFGHQCIGFPTATYVEMCLSHMWMCIFFQVGNYLRQLLLVMRTFQPLPSFITHSFDEMQKFLLFISNWNRNISILVCLADWQFDFTKSCIFHTVVQINPSESSTQQKWLLDTFLFDAYKVNKTNLLFTKSCQNLIQ